jgi:hypothetical protein
MLTDVVIVCDDSEAAALAYLNQWLLENDPRKQQLKEISLEDGGGQKATSATVYAACFNFLPVGDFEDAIRQAPWNFPESVAAYIDFEADRTRVMTPGRPESWPLHPQPSAIV